MARRDNEKAAKALVELALGAAIEKVAERYNVTTRTLRNWRKLIGEDAELSTIFAAHIRIARRGDWGQELERTHTKALQMLGQQLDLLELDSEVALAERMTLTLSVINSLGDMQIAREVLGAGVADSQENTIFTAAGAADARGQEARPLN